MPKKTTELVRKTDEPQEIISPLEHIDRQIAVLLKAELALDQGWANVGLLLAEVSEKNYWRGTFDSFNDYLTDLGEKHRKGRTQLYHYFSTVKALAEHATPTELNAMGIAKANEFRKALKAGIVPPKDVIEAALKPTNRAEDVEKMLYASAPNKNPQNGQEQGTWHSLGGAYFTDEEWQTFCDARNAAWHTDPVTKEDLPEWVRLKDALLKMSQEYLGANAGNLPDQKEEEVPF